MLARLTGKSGGVENLRIAEYPGPVGIHTPEQIAQNIEHALLDQIVAGLTHSEVGGTAAKAGGGDPHAVVFTGTADEIARHYAEQEWTDGLPIVPPTVERVERFLRFTDRTPDEEIAILPAANLRATPWNIAVNAIMAGCAPAHLPLLIAAVEAMGDERCSLNNIGSSSGIFPFMLVNGPLVKQLGIESGGQLVSRGPNPAIGRAIGLIVKNIAGFRPGARYMGTFGYPLAVTLAEHDDSPWPRLAADQGFPPDANTVTMGVTNNWGASPAPYDTPDQPGAQVALQLLAKEIKQKTRLYHFPGSGPDAEHVMVTLLLSPPVAKSLADAGYSKADVRRHLYEHTTMRLADFDWIVKSTAIERTSCRAKVEAGVFPPEFAGSPDDQVRVLSSPDILHIIVCGDPHRNRVMVMEGGHTQPTTREVRLPKNWDDLLTQGR